MKIGFVASSGGHWVELMCIKGLAEGRQCFFVTETGGQAEEARETPMYTLPQINRHEKSFLLHFFRLFRNAKRILKKERPDVLVTTGALIAYPFCLLTKLRGGKVIYIESFARVNKKSLTGRLVYPFADLFIVQWESQVKHYKKAIYGGCLY